MDREYFFVTGYLVGGAITFTVHLLYTLRRNYILRVGAKKLGSHMYELGYGIHYQNVPAEVFQQCKNPFITTEYKITEFMNPEYLKRDDLTIVIHDPQEIKFKEIQDIIHKYGQDWKIITIRKPVSEYIKKHYDVDSTFMLHPFYKYPKDSKSEKKNMDKFVSISRIDFDKNTNIILESNRINNHWVDIYGSQNRIYVFHKLNKEYGDLFDKSYKGTFPKTFNAVSTILDESVAVVDMSTGKDDGGGTQYTFLEAIHHDCLLILNRKWTDVKGSVFIEGKNCLAVSDGKELNQTIDDIKKEKVDRQKILSNAKKLLDKHTKVDWSRL